MKVNDTANGQLPERIESPGRRSFLSLALSTVSMVFFGFVVYPVLRYLKQPTGSTGTMDKVIAAKASEVKEDFWKIFRFGDHPGILINTPEGHLKSFTAVCTHLGCTVQYMPDKQHIFCACHNGVFDLNGQVVSGPPPLPLEEYKVNMSNEEIIVSRA